MAIIAPSEEICRGYGFNLPKLGSRSLRMVERNLGAIHIRII